jgi:hypothetical protein
VREQLVSSEATLPHRWHNQVCAWTRVRVGTLAGQGPTLFLSNNCDIQGPQYTGTQYILYHHHPTSTCMDAGGQGTATQSCHEPAT